MCNSALLCAIEQGRNLFPKEMNDFLLCSQNKHESDAMVCWTNFLGGALSKLQASALFDWTPRNNEKTQSLHKILPWQHGPWWFVNNGKHLSFAAFLCLSTQKWEIEFRSTAAVFNHESPSFVWLCASPSCSHLGSSDSHLSVGQHDQTRIFTGSVPGLTAHREPSKQHGKHSGSKSFPLVRDARLLCKTMAFLTLLAQQVSHVDAQVMVWQSILMFGFITVSPIGELARTNPCSC